MRQKIENNLVIICEGVDLTTISNIEFYVTQGKMFFKYTPTVESPNRMLVNIPYKDAMRLEETSVNLQFAFLHADGRPDASEPETLPVRLLLKRAGYDPT